jgi:hypothetical protein
MRNCGVLAVGMLAALMALLAGPASEASVTIDFDDGADGGSVGSFYSGLGVTFSNATWTGNMGLLGSSGTLGIRATIYGDWAYQVTPTNPIVATFDAPQQMVGVRVLDVGANGARIVAYDAVAGGNVIGSDEFFGPDVGVGWFADIAVDQPAIRRVEFYQPLYVASDGVVWDDFTFQESGNSTVPEPAAFVVWSLLGGIGVAVGWRWRKTAA